MSRPITRRTLLAGSLAVGATGLLSTACSASTPPAAGPGVAIVGATVFDTGGGAARRDHTVVVRGDRITAVGPVASTPVPPAVTVLDGRGRYLVPALVDLHVHSVPFDAVFPPLYLVNGVTTVREMSGNPAAWAMRGRVERGEVFGPRCQVGSVLVDGAPSLWEGIGPPFASVGTAAEARAVVGDQQAQGAEFVKTYTRLGRAAFDAIAAEATARDLPFLGHCPDFVPITDASDAGMRTLEHLFQFWYAMSRRETEFRAAVAATPIAGGEYGGWYARMHAIEYAAARDLDPAKAADVAARLAANGTWVSPTLVQHRVADDPGSVNREDPRLRYLPASYAAGFPAQLDAIYAAGGPGQLAQKQELLGRRRELVALLADAGVPLLAGTDTGTPYLLPGFALHDELDQLVAAGLTPAAALHTATLEAARYLGRDADQGTIDPGKIADLLLLDADPTRDITATRRIDAVVVRGCPLDRDARRRLLDEVAVAARDPALASMPRAVCPCCARR